METVRGVRCAAQVRQGLLWVNSVLESFLSSLQLELDLDDDRKVLISPQQLQRALAFWIDGNYIRERSRSTIGYPNPINDKQRFIAAPTLSLVNRCSVSTKLEESKSAATA